jgi:hypothetical protein
MVPSTSSVLTRRTCRSTIESEAHMSFLRSLSSRIRDLFGDLPIFGNKETRVARYIVLSESAGGFPVPQESGISDRHFLDIKAPGFVPQVFPVIFFRTVNTGTPRFSVRLNQNHLTQHQFTDSGPHSWHEIIPSGGLKAEGNELIFAVNGEGSVRFSDVVILYTSSDTTIETPPVLDPG